MTTALSLDENQAHYQIKGFAPGKIQINENFYTQSLIVTPTQLMTDWRPQQIKELTRDDLDAIISLQPAILLLGTGSTLTFPPLAIYGHLINLGIGIEIMHTAAASRTYNALTAENRNVAAALLLT